MITNVRESSGFSTVYLEAISPSIQAKQNKKVWIARSHPVPQPAVPQCRRWRLEVLIYVVPSYIHQYVACQDQNGSNVWQVVAAQQPIYTEIYGVYRPSLLLVAFVLKVQAMVCQNWFLAAHALKLGLLALKITDLVHACITLVSWQFCRDQIPCRTWQM